MLIGWAVILDITYGLLFALAQGISCWDGLYFAVVTGTTTGYGDIAPHGWLPHLIAIAIMVNVIPLITGCFSLVTAGLSGTHISQLGTGLHERLEQLEAAAGRLEQHLEDFRG